MKNLKNIDKKKAIIFVLIAAVVIGGVGFGISYANHAKETKLIEEKKEQVKEKKELAKEKHELEDKMEEELANAKTEEEKQAIKEKYQSKIDKVQNKIEHVQTEINKTEDKIEQVQKPSKPSGGSSDTTKPESKPETKPETKPESKPEEKPSKPSKPTEPEKKKVWVVDKPAWDEVVDDKTKPIYEYKETYYIYFRDGTSKKYYDYDQWNYDCEYAPGVSSYEYGDYEEVLVGYEKKTIHHKEEGHWEYI